MSAEEHAAGGDRIHLPVLLDEILAFFAPAPGFWIIDGTLGFGGHSERFLERGASVIGVDQDPEALGMAQERLAVHGDHFHPLAGNASQLTNLLATHTNLPSQVDAILFDLGVSSWQLDQAHRGFSFQSEGPLDMRMDPSGTTTAADLVNGLEEAELAHLLWAFGEERASRRIARAIVNSRETQSLQTTKALADLVSRVSPKKSRIHPATRTFQALRIAVNRELEVLPEMLEQAMSLLKPGGKLAVISFHSLEDRIVKRFLRERSQAELDDPTWPSPKPNPHYQVDLPHKWLKATEEEAAHNPRARSAKLRVAIRRPNS